MAFDQQLNRKAQLAGGKKYTDLFEVASRQAISDHAMVEAPSQELLFLSR